MKRQINQGLAISLLVLMALPLQGNLAADRLGPIYPIIEPDWLEWLPKQAEKRLRERSLTLSKDQLKQTIRRQMSGLDLPDAKVPRTYFVDPAVKINQPVADHTGNIVIPAGGRINPLEYLPAFRPIVIIDGRKERHVEWLKGIITQTRPLVLISSGDVIALNKQLDVPIYPVPKGLIERFSIERVPVLLSQEGKRIRVEEMVP